MRHCAHSRLFKTIYLAIDIRSRINDILKSIKEVNKEIIETDIDLANAQTRLKNFYKNHGLVPPPDDPNGNDDKKTDAPKTAARYRIELYEKTLEELERIASESEDKEEKRTARQLIKEKRAAEQRAQIIRESAAQVVQLQTENVKAEIDALDEGLEKKLQLSKHSEQQELARLRQDFDKRRAVIESKLREIEAAQKGLLGMGLGNSPEYEHLTEQYKALSAEQVQLTEATEARRSGIIAAATDYRINLVRQASTKELNAYAEVLQMRLKGYDEESDAYRQTLGEIAAVRANLDLQYAAERVSRMLDIQEAGDNARREAERTYRYTADRDNALELNRREHRRRHIENEVSYREELLKTYQEELQALALLGATDTERYGELLRLLGSLQTELLNIGRGKNPDGSRKGFWQQMLELSDEEIQQIQQQAFDLASSIGSQIVQAAQQASQRRLNNEKKAIQNEYETYSKML